LQLFFVKKSGDGNLAVRASLIGMIVEAFLLLPFGFLIGAFSGVKIEYFIYPLNVAFGALFGFIFWIYFEDSF
tara:strand:- start:470 stop:688 length:219 start_codon:yes stop_codon:yes gene_type:complete